MTLGHAVSPWPSCSVRLARCSDARAAQSCLQADPCCLCVIGRTALRSWRRVARWHRPCRPRFQRGFSAVVWPTGHGPWVGLAGMGVCERSCWMAALSLLGSPSLGDSDQGRAPTLLASWVANGAAPCRLQSLHSNHRLQHSRLEAQMRVTRRECSL